MEIGPGQGALTKHLLKTKAIIYAIEYDETLYDQIKDNFKSYNNFFPIYEDILQFDLATILPQVRNSRVPRQNVSGSGVIPSSISSADRLIPPKPGAGESGEPLQRRIKIIGNLPYNIASPIVSWCIKNIAFISEVYITLQKEVGMRLTATPSTKEYGSFTIAVGTYFKITKLMELPAQVFYPKPKVDSWFINLVVHSPKNLKVKDENIFYELVRIAFRSRRKTLGNNLRIAQSPLFGFTRKEIEMLEARSGIAFSRRAESLSLEEFTMVSDTIYGFKKIPIS